MKRNFKDIALFIVILSALGACGKAEFAPLQAEGPTSIPTPGPSPVCIQVKDLGIWLDANGDGDISGETFLGKIQAFTGEIGQVENYNYFSWSAHPLVGPQPIGYASQVYVYEGTDGLGLVFYHNVDRTDPNYNGSTYNEVRWEVVTSGNANKDHVFLTDDIRPASQVPASGPNQSDGTFHELSTDASRTDAEKTTYVGDWQYWDNTDGGIIGPFEGEDYLIQVKIDQTGNVNNAMFHSADGASFPLKDQNNQISSFIIGFLQTRCL